MIKAFFWGLAILLGLLLIQTTLMNYIALWNVKPDIVLLVFMFLAVQNGSLVSGILGFSFGICFDLMTGSVLGYHAFIFTLFGYLIGFGKGKVFFDSFAIPLLAGFVITIVYTITSFLVSYIFNINNNFSFYFNTALVIQLLYNVILTPVVWAIISFIKNKTQGLRRGGFDGSE